MRALESRHDSHGFGMAAVLNRGEVITEAHYRDSIQASMGPRF